MFPDSEHIKVDGRNNWPYSWFYWMNEAKKSKCKYFIHVDEDFFFTSKEELFKVIDKMEANNIDLIGVPDGYHQYRGANPAAINTFLMIGKVSILKDLDFSNLSFGYDQNKGWINNMGLSYKGHYNIDYPFTIQAKSNFNFEQEPYYAFLWTLKEKGVKFDYLFPYFDDRFKSTNPRLNESSLDIGIHMWYTRQWNQDFDVHGIPNNKRYDLVESFIKEKYGL
jgi:hypothetical protein